MGKERELTNAEARLGAIAAKLYADANDSKLDVAVVQVMHKAQVKFKAKDLDKIYEVAQELKLD